MRILIVDDRRDIGLLMRRLVEQAGHEASLAVDGYEAIRLAEELPPDAVLLDINMPGIDGYKTARRLRERFRDQFPIFAVTADPVEILRANESGFDGIFSKPFSAAKLDALLSLMA